MVSKAKVEQLQPVGATRGHTDLLEDLVLV